MFDLRWLQEFTLAVWTYCNLNWHKMTHLTLAGRDPFQLTFSSTDFHQSKAKSATVAQTHPPLSGPLVFFRVQYMLLRQDGYTNEKWESVTHFSCLFPLTNSRHDVYHVTMVALQSSYSLWCIFLFSPHIWGYWKDKISLKRCISGLLQLCRYQTNMQLLGESPLLFVKLSSQKSWEKPHLSIGACVRIEVMLSVAVNLTGATHEDRKWHQGGEAQQRQLLYRMCSRR